MVRLFHSVEHNSTHTGKYQEHGTAILKLVPPEVRKVLLKLAKEDS